MAVAASSYAIGYYAVAGQRIYYAGEDPSGNWVIADQTAGAYRFSIAPTGNITVNNALTAAQLQSTGNSTVGALLYLAYPTVSDFILFRQASVTSRYLQFASGYYWQFNESSGQLLAVANNALALTITGTFVAAAAQLQCSGIFYALGGAAYIRQVGAGNCVCYFQDSGGANRGGLYWLGADGTVHLWNAIGGASAWVDQANQFFTGNTAFKPGGGPWTATSDERIKTVLGDYAGGLDQVLALRPVRYVYKGNDTTTADVSAPRHEEMRSEVTAAPYPSSFHYELARTQKELVGFVAQEVETVLPEMVYGTPGFIDGEAVPDLRRLDTGPLIFALVNAVKELAQRLTTLEARTR